MSDSMSVFPVPMRTNFNEECLTQYVFVRCRNIYFEVDILISVGLNIILILFCICYNATRKGL